MKRRPFFLLLLPVLAGLAVAMQAPTAHAGEDDHDRARRAVEAGEIKPLRDILAAAEAAYGGQLIEAELERRHGGRMVYELKLLTVEGRLLKVYYDAHSGLPLDPSHGDDRK